MLGALLARRYALDTTFVSRPQAPLPTTAWDEQLAAARGDLHAFADALRASLSAGHRAIVAMGRCAAGLATIPVVAERHPDACVVWFDAHGDSNLPSSNAVPYLGGMVLTGAATAVLFMLPAGHDRSPRQPPTPPVVADAVSP